MISTKELAAQLGPKQKKALQEVADARDGARKRVKDLEALRTERQAEAQPFAVVATMTPADVAEAQALAAGVGALVRQIDKELTAAKDAETNAAHAYNRFVEGVQRRQRRIAELDGDIANLTSQRDKLKGELAA